MTSFLYRKIGYSLLNNLREKVIVQSESVVLIAPRHGGKRYVMNCLFDMLQAEKRFLVLRLNATPQTNVANAREFRDWLATAVQEVDGRFNEQALSSEDMFAPLDWLIAGSEKPVVLLVSNVDSLSQLLARDLLLKIRTLVEERTLIAALSGEDIFQKLVYGPASEFNCTYQYFLQGFDRELFAEETYAYRKTLGLHFDNDEAVVSRLYELAGGHLSIMKTLLRSIIEARFERRHPLGLSIAVSKIPESIGSDLLRQPPRVINNAPECWEDLKQLVHDDLPRISSNPAEPGPLELAGVAVRDGWNIQISSPLLKNFLKGYYTNKRFGDLYVRKNDFDTAFAYYEQLSEEERVRPSNSDDRREIAFTITALAAHLHFVATESPNEVGKLFFKTCRYVLGFREVGCLRLNSNEKWDPWPFPGCHLSEETVKELNQLLPKSDPEIGVFPITGSVAHFALAAVAPTERPDQFLAIVVCDQAAGRTISPERRRLTLDLLSHFVEAYKQATQIVAARNHLETRDKHIKIANSIFDALGSRAQNVEHVIGMAAQSLRSLGYRRVSFCLVDPEKKKIKGVWDESDDKSVDVAALTDWMLDDPTADIQPYVIKKKEPKIVPDADCEPLVNPIVREKAHLKAFAVVPLLAQDGEAIGTMHVEKEDGSVPSQEEVDDLAHFGRQLAIAISQSERVNLQQGTLDKLLSTTLIVDSTRKLRYANQIAGEILGVKSGWRDQANAESLTQDILGEEAMTLILESLSGHRRERRVKLPKDHDDTRYWEALSHVIHDSNGQALGAFIRIRDVAFPHRMFKAFNLIAEAKDKASVLGQLLVAAERHLEFKWGRLYLVGPGDPDCLVSYDFFGKLPIHLQNSFQHGGTRMPRRNRPGKETWTCLDHGIPMVFYFAPHLEDGITYTTQKGQEACVVTNPRLQVELQKRPNDFWVDLPLRRQDGQPIGKITFEWSEDRWPREFDLLEVLAEMVSRRLEAFQEREREEERLEAVRTQTAQKIMATVAHNIGTQLSALPVLLTRYRLREKDMPALQELNQRFAMINQETSKLINRARERLVGVSPKPSRLNLKECLHETLKSYLEDKCWRIECPYHFFEVQADSYLLKQALYELIQNSKDVSSGFDKLEITISLEFELRPESEVAKIIYRDNGPGVPKNIKERIFEDFFTHHPGGDPGTGLGMGFVRRVAEAHGGEIKECGVPGKGVEFVITLPVEQAAEVLGNTSQEQLPLLSEWQSAAISQ